MLTGKKKISISSKIVNKNEIYMVKIFFFEKNNLYLCINNLKTKKTWVIHTKTVKEKLTSFTQKT